MNKILFIGFYDYPWGTRAYELVNNELTEVPLTKEEFNTIYSHNGWCFADNPNLYEDLLSKYDSIFVCEDGEFTKLK